MKFIFLLFFISNIAFALPKIEQNPKHFPKKDLPIDQIYDRNIRLSADVGSRTNFTDGYILSGQITYQMQYFGFDSRVSYSDAKFETFFTKPRQADKDATTSAASLGDETSEVNRQRKGTDRWSYLLIQPGFSVTGKFFPNKMRRFSQTGRFGFGKVFMRDSAYRNGFRGWIATWDAHFNYQLSERSPYSLFVGATYNFGWVNSMDATHDRKSTGRIPMGFFLVHLGMNYSFL